MLSAKVASPAGCTPCDFRRGFPLGEGFNERERAFAESIPALGEGPESCSAHRCHRAVLLQWHNLPSSEQCSSTSQIPHALTIFFKSATIAFIFGRYQIDFWF
jgi:hypothetical protein